MSHIGIWGRLARMGPGVEWALVLEDDADVRLPEDWDRVVEMAVANTPVDWELLWVGATHIINPEKNVEVNSHVNLNASLIWGTHAYLIKREAAGKLYEALKGYEQTHVLADFESLAPVDYFLSENKVVPLRQYVLSHDVIGQRDMGSDTNVDKPESPCPTVQPPAVTPPTPMKNAPTRCSAVSCVLWKPSHWKLRRTSA